MNGLIGKKIGMTSFYDEAGKNIPCTVIEVTPNVVSQVKTEETDGYSALQLAFGERKEKNSETREKRKGANDNGVSKTILPPKKN